MASKSTLYYKEHPHARKVKEAYQKEYNKKPGESESRVLHAKKRKELGLKKGDACDASQTKSGKWVKENRKTNRGRQGANGKSTKK